MKDFEVSDEFSRGWCDAQLIGLDWTNSGRDVVIRADFMSDDGKANRVRELKCSWTRAINIGLTFALMEGGCPMVWEAIFQRKSESAISVCIRFGSAGEISLECSEIDWLEEQQ